MNRLPETVNQQFNQLFAVIGQAGDDLKLASAEASMAGNFSLVTVNIENCQRLQALEMVIRNCLGKFESGKPVSLQDGNRQQRGRRHPPKPSDLMRVRLAGKVIQERTMTRTFVETLKALGLDKIAKLNKTITSIPLVSRQGSTGYQRQERYNGWFITTHINKQNAPVLLKEIARDLNVPMQIEFFNK